MGQSNSGKQALVILVGITADEMKRKYVYNFFSKNSPYDVYVPTLPQRLGVRFCAWRLHRYLMRNVKPRSYSRVHFFNYISGGVIYRSATDRWPLPNIGRVVYGRGPVQEAIPRELVNHYGRIKLWISQGKMITDLATDWLARLPYPTSLDEQGLTIETGVSALARSLAINPEDLPPEAWEPGKLLPGASSYINVAESHDQVYTSPRYLSTVLHFFNEGVFNTE